jgi:hypothetical protein
MRNVTGAAALIAFVVAAGCTGPTTDSGRLAGPAHQSRSADVSTLGSCTTFSALRDLASQVFGAGSPNAQSVIGKLNNLDKFVQQGDVVDAQAQAQNIVTFVQLKASQGTLPGTSQQVDAFIGSVLCYAGLSPNTFLIQPGDHAQVLATNSGKSGVSLQAHTVTVPTLLTIDERDPTGPSGLDTKLDQYPTYISITTSSQLIDSAVVAVCIPASLGLTSDVFNRLRLGHQASGGFEITPAADPGFLGCPSAVSSNSKLPHWLRTLASLVMPKPLYAGTALFATGGVGGAAIEFSPFGAVDNALFATGGVGGAAIEFQRAPNPAPALAPSRTTDTAAPRPSAQRTANSSFSGSPSYSVYDANGTCLSADTTVGQALDPRCRPLITIRTGKGTLMTGVPVAWAVTAGGGTVAPDTLTDNACGSFETTATNATNAGGKAAVCWTLGPAAGTNRVTATPAFGGDAPDGVIFVDGSGHVETGVEFTATADLIPTTAAATGETVPYDGLAHPGTAGCSHGLTPARSYDTPDGSAPSAIGSYTLTVTCGAGSTAYAVSTAAATIVITRRPATATAGSGTMSYGGSVPTLPCTVTGLLAADAGTVTCTTSVPATLVPGLNVTTAVVSPSAPAHYAMSTVTGTLAVRYVKSDCFASPIYSSQPPTKSAQKLGSNLPIKCTLLTASGGAATNASGDLTITDMGATGAGPGTVVFHLNAAFAPQENKNYSYGFDTSILTSGHFYIVSSAWNDGSTTTGWFYVK